MRTELTNKARPGYHGRALFNVGQETLLQAGMGFNRYSITRFATVTVPSLMVIVPLMVVSPWGLV